MDTDSCAPVTNPHNRTGQNVAIVVLPAPEPFTTAKSLAKPFQNRGKGSNERRSKREACITDNAPHNQNNQMSQNRHLFKLLLLPKTLTTDTLQVLRRRNDHFWSVARGRGCRAAIVRFEPKAVGELHL